MTAWTDDQLTEIGGAGEIEIAPMGADGKLRPSRTIWVARLGDDLYIRSVNGPEGAWYRALEARHAGRITAAGVNTEVVFEDADHDLDDAIDQEYRRKYGSSTSVDRITAERARSTTIRLFPV
jgi:hypothetical protein